MTMETYIRSDLINYNKRRKQIQTSIYSYRIYLIDIYIPATYAIYREYEFRIGGDYMSSIPVKKAILIKIF